jgi:UDP-2-acetamido-3-amino-2,3-dideoxy-glucuronate N-acetyltransferase
MERKDVRIHPTAEVSDLAEIGEGTNIWHQVQIMDRSRIGRRCNIGKGVYVDYDVVLGDECRVQNYVCIYHGVKIGNRVFLGPHCVFTNDMHPRAFHRDFEVVQTVVEEGASICANATIICGNRIGAYSMVGAGSVVTKDVPAHALVYGNPAKIAGYVCEMGHSMERTRSAYRCGLCGEEFKPGI